MDVTNPAAAAAERGPGPEARSPTRTARPGPVAGPP